MTSISKLQCSVQFSHSVVSASLWPHGLQPCISSGSSMEGLMVTSSKRAYAILKSAAPRAPITVAVHCLPALVIGNTLFQKHKRRLYTCGYHQMVNTKIKLIIFFAAKDLEALHSQQKQDRELTVAQIMNSLLQNSDLNWRKPFILIIQVWSKSNPLRLYSRSDKEIQRIRFDRVPEKLWMEMRTGGSDQDHPQEEEIQKIKMVV